MQATRPTCMPVENALQVLVDVRQDHHLVVSNQGSARLWPRLSEHSADFSYNPSNMGGAVPLALGMALSCPTRELVVLSGDGSLLMNLGCLVTVVNSGATNITVIVLDNAMYEVTGGQSTPASRGRTSYAKLADAAGFAQVDEFRCAQQWRHAASAIFTAPGPRFVQLHVACTQLDCLGDAPLSMPAQIERLRQTLARAT